jgi:predicted Zn-ribbon and HTH transcriptional regulator
MAKHVKMKKEKPPICMACKKHFDGVELLHKSVTMNGAALVMACVVCPNCGAAFEVKLIPPETNVFAPPDKKVEIITN